MADTLTAREQEILGLVAHGLSNRDIAEELVVAPETVRWYTKQIYSKLGVHGRVPALVRAKELGLLQEESSKETVVSPPITTPQKHNMPASITPFIGRGHEIAEVIRLLQTSRLLTLTGVGGTGKTRLALEVASQVIDDFPDGVCYVNLCSVPDASMVAKGIAFALGVMENVQVPLPDMLKRVLADKELLLLLDNFEHVLEAAPLVSELLAAAPRVKALVTSREALRLSGEQEYAVPPLSLPSMESISLHSITESEAVTLFVQRAQMILPYFALSADNAPAIGQICSRLDGLPLAIELAAARCKLLTPQVLLDRLDSRLNVLTGGSRDALPRQRSLRATIEWSYNLLDEGEKTLFARLSVFSAGRSLEAVEAVCSEGLSIDVFDGLASLVDKNLVPQKETAWGEPRFFMLETILEYTQERLEESGEAEAIRRRHAEYFVELAERAQPQLRLAEQVRWSQVLETEYENIRAALEWSVRGDVTFAVRLAGALTLFWYANGYHVEGQHWIGQLLDRLGEVPKTYHAKFWICAGHMATFYDLAIARDMCQKALNISRELGDTLGTAWSNIYVGYCMMGNTEAALAIAEEGLALFRELDHKPGIAQALTIIGEVARYGGNDDRARRAYEECLTVAQQTGETRRLELTFLNLAFVAQHDGDHTRAIDLARQGLLLAQEMNNRLEVCRSLATLAGSIGASGQPERAACLFGASETVIGSMGAFHVPEDIREYNQNIADLRAQLDEATFEAAWAKGRKMTLEQAVKDALEEPR
jgi:non-specific serine/threonine protein kinase